MAKAGFILIVEDDPDTVTLLVRALEKHGVQEDIVVSRDGAEALAFLHQPPGPEPAKRPRFVLLDLNLPKLSGHEVLARLRADARTSLLPVVVFSSSGMESDVLASYKLGANSYVYKPVDFAAFNEAVRDVAHYWMKLNRQAG